MNVVGGADASAIPMVKRLPARDRRKEGRTSPRARAGGPEISKKPSAALVVFAANIRRLVSTGRVPLLRLTRQLQIDIQDMDHLSNSQEAELDHKIRYLQRFSAFSTI